MMKFLLNYKTELLSALVSLMGGVYLTFTICSWYYNSEITAQAQHLALEQQNAVTNERKTCAANQAITEETSNDLQTALADSHKRLIALNDKLHAAGRAGACVPITAATSGHDGAAVRNLPALQGGVVAESLIGAAGLIDDQTARLIACQRFITDTWKAHRYRAPATGK